MTGAARLWRTQVPQCFAGPKANKTGLKSDLKGDRGVEWAISVNHARICATRRVLDAVFARLPELPPPKANRFASGIPPATARAAGFPALNRNRRRLIDPAHFDGLAGFELDHPAEHRLSPIASPVPALLRQLGEYEAIVGGSF